MNEENIDIFVCTHKDFEPVVKSEVYKILDSRSIKANLPLDDKFYSELYHMKYVYDNVKLKKYVGFCQYRKYFSFLDEFPDFEKLFSDFDCIIASVMNFETDLIRQYSTVGNVEDLFIIESIIMNKFPEYYEVAKAYLNGKQIILGNMFIMKSEDFKKYCKFVFGVLDEYLGIIGLDITQRIWNRKQYYLKGYYPNNTIEYQYRIGGQMGERLTGIFMHKNFANIGTVGLKITENKYGPGETNDK